MGEIDPSISVEDVLLASNPEACVGRKTTSLNLSSLSYLNGCHRKSSCNNGADVDKVGSNLMQMPWHVSVESFVAYNSDLEPGLVAFDEGSNSVISSLLQPA